MCVAYTATLDGKCVVLKTPLPDTTHAEVAANDLEVCTLVTFIGVFSGDMSRSVLFPTYNNVAGFEGS